ncbi:MAG: type II toxin-antitoxin system Phd/YefM family antitoxin [Coriobacteriales bacterium]|nr:type II toxin-antitoxin system Phd/YefM family antitoxin [Coriobacteriales bacterium]
MPQPDEWQLQEAKNKFSEVVRRSRQGPQTITLHGRPSAVVLSFDEYLSLKRPRKTLVEVMRSAPGGFEGLAIERDPDRTLRDVVL